MPNTEPQTNKPSQVEGALRLVRAGHMVFPVAVVRVGDSVQKRPLVPAPGFHLASSDEDQVRRWWAEHPDAAIGLALPRETTVVDLDSYKPNYRRDHGLHLPDTLKQETIRGGWQLFYRTDGRTPRQMTGVHGHPIDTRTPGKGYVVAWEPEVIANAPVETWAFAPEWVYEGRNRKSSIPFDDAPIPSGLRHDYYLTRGGEYARIGMPPYVIEAALLAENGRRSPDHDEADICAIAESSAEWTPVLHTLRFYCPLELAAMTRPEPDWIVRPGLVAVSSITELDGKIKAAGKTTLILWMIRAILDGVPFLGAPTRQAKVLYVTEQSRQTFMDALRLVGLADRGEEFRILFREDFHGATWAKIVAAARQDGYELVVFDTIGKLAGIREENAAGEWAAAMSPLQDLAAAGRAVVIARHDRKGGGDIGDSGRGSSQASGDVDIILAVRRPEGNQPGNRRVVEGLSRYRETPEKIVIELTAAGYVLLGSVEAVAASEADAFVRSAIGSEFRTNGIGPDLTELTALGDKLDPKVRRTTISVALARLGATGEIAHSGGGKKGDPFRYHPHAADSFRTQTLVNGAPNETQIELEGMGPPPVVSSV
jgi:hypothetical protein